MLFAQLASSDSIGFVTDSLSDKEIRGSISLIHREKNNKTAELTIDRIFGVEIDSVFYRGEVVQLMDSLITFHAYFVDGKSTDSVYQFLLDSVTNIGFYYATHPERYFKKHVKAESKHGDEVEDFFRVTQYIGATSLIYSMVSGFFNQSLEKSPAIILGEDPVILKIGIYSLFANAGYIAFLAIRQYSTITYYDLEYNWQIVPD